MENFKKLIQLSANDNVLVLPVNASTGDILTFNGENYTLSESITLGHKIASQDIKKGHKIIKFNVPIGSATKDIKRGEHVHTHNMKSDFIASHTRDN